MHKIVNALGFQAGWWACVAGVGLGFEIESIVFCMVLAGLHLYVSTAPRQECTLAFLAVLVGIVVDSLLQHLSVIQFDGKALGLLSPFWLWALWGIFALTLNSSLAFLKRQSLIVSAALGWVFGPATYYAGSTLGAAELDVTPVRILALGTAWAIAMPLLVVIAQRTSPLHKDLA
jgi:hypothetical protein